MLTLTDIAALAERSLKRTGDLAPLFLFEGTKTIQARELPYLPERDILDHLEALGFTFAYTDEIGDVMQLFFLCRTWLNRNEGIPASEDPHRFEGVFLYHRVIRSGTWDVACYRVVRSDRNEVIEMKASKASETVFSDVMIGPPVDRFLRGFRRGVANK